MSTLKSGLTEGGAVTHGSGRPGPLPPEGLCARIARKLNWLEVGTFKLDISVYISLESKECRGKRIKQVVLEMLRGEVIVKL